MHVHSVQPHPVREEHTFTQALRLGHEVTDHPSNVTMSRHKVGFYMGLKSNLLGQSRESLPTGLYGVSKVNLCLPLRQGPNYLIEAENAGRIAPPAT